MYHQRHDFVITTVQCPHAPHDVHVPNFDAAVSAPATVEESMKNGTWPPWRVRNGTWAP